MDYLVAISIGVGLAAACGFRVFVPMLAVGIAARAGLVTLADGFVWISTWVAIGTFLVASLLEIGAYYIPWVDNALDTVSSPAAVIAGAVLTAAFVHDMDPLLKWSLAIIAGGGAAGTVKAGLAGLRLTSTATTAGTTNPVVSTVEWISALVMSLLAIFLPLVAFAVAILLVGLFIRVALRLRRRVPEDTSNGT